MREKIILELGADIKNDALSIPSTLIPEQFLDDLPGEDFEIIDEQTNTDGIARAVARKWE